MKSPLRPTTDDARNLAHRLLKTATFAALAVQSDDGPMVSRIAFAMDTSDMPCTLISDLSHHTKWLRQNPNTSLLIGEPAQKGDPLTHPRMTLQTDAQIVEHNDQEYAQMAQHYVQQRPKSKLYISFTDFIFVKFKVKAAYLNGGFGKAFALTPDDLIQKRGPIT